MLDRVIPQHERASEVAAVTPPADALRPIVLGSDVRLAANAARRAEARRFGLGVAMAVALHAGALALFSQVPTDDRVGTAGQSLDSISVEVTLVPAVAAEALSAAAPPEPVVSEAGAALPVTTGSISKPKTEPVREPEPRTEQVEPKTRTEQVEPAVVSAPPDPSPQDADMPILSIAAPLPPAKVELQPPAAPAASSTPVEAAIAPSPGKAPSRGAAAPSAGAIQAFARSVAEALARTRPKSAPGAGRGTVKIAFSVSDGGGLEGVRVAQSSGRPDIDQAALAAVRRAAFPAPPTGLSLAQRTYEIPYHFR